MDSYIYAIRDLKTIEEIEEEEDEWILINKTW